MRIAKKFIVLSVAIAPFIFSCGNKGESDKKTDAKKNEEVKAVSVKDAVAKVNESEANSGQEVVVKGYFWAKSSTSDGIIHVDMGDAKLEGMQQAPLSANFSADKKDKLSSLTKDNMITVKGKIMKTPYVVYMDNCELIKVE